MRVDFKNRAQNINGYSDQSFNFLDQDAHNFIAHIVSIDLIENGDGPARESWQRKQLNHLINHAYVRSEFWRRRIPSGWSKQDGLRNLPILTRKEISVQVQQEGSLLADKARGGGVSTYETTGSTGTPLKVFVSERNAYYNLIRGLAQFFIDNLPLDRNRVRILSPIRSEELKRSSVQDSKEHWAGALSKIYRNGSWKTLRFNKDVEGLLEELSKGSVNYLTCPSRILEQLLDHGGTELIKRLGVEAWFHISDYRSPEAVEQLKAIGITCLSNYSSAELGPIAFECIKNAGYYHVAHSNVIVECDERLTSTFGEEVVGRLLVTHLYSYATPLIRYDVGDFGKLHDRCPCGHNGPTLSHIYGRGKHFLRHPDGHYLPFHLTTRALREVVDFTECRFRQETMDTITVQIGGRETLSPEEEEKLKATVIAVTDPVFKVVIKPVREIDWSDNPKQLFFSSAVV
jgi:phenylacetate-CoA ligase